MSMISAQIDELRKLADGQAPYRDARAAMLEAADTILVMDERLRDAERHHRIDMDVVGLMYHPEIVERLNAENDKLRELVLEIWRSCPVSEDDCAKCQHRIEESDENWCDIPILMEKLGVEVDE